MRLRSRALLLHAPYQPVWLESDLPTPGSEEVLVRTLFSSISTGTEVAQLKGEDPIAAARAFPAKLGYENVAQVIRPADSASYIEEGAYVVATYGHRDFALVRADRLIPIERPDPAALLLILAGDTAKGVLALAPDFNGPVVITGAGAIGLLTLFNLQSRGHVNIDVVDPIEERRTLADRFGARRVFTPGEFAHSATVYKTAFECSGDAEAFIAIQNHMAHSGNICVLSDARSMPLKLAPAFHDRELRIQASSDGLEYREYAKWFFANASRYPLEDIFDRQIRFPELPSTLMAMAAGTIQPRKVLVKYE